VGKKNVSSLEEVKAINKAFPTNHEPVSYKEEAPY